MGAKKNKDKKEVSAGNEPRQLKAPKYQSFKLQKRLPKLTMPKMPSAFRLFGATLRLLVKNWKLFGGLALLFGLFNILLVQGLSGVLSSQNQGFENTQNTDSWSQFLNGIVVFTSMAGTQVNSEAASAYQFFLTLIFSLGIIWALREIYAGNAPRIRDALYQGMYPLVPYIVILTIIVLQMVPVVIGGFVYGLVTASITSLSGVEVLFWTVIFGLTGLISLYLLCSSVIALYIACLQNMTPLRALRSARELIHLRRWEVMRKILFLPVALLVCGAVITVPFIYIAAPVAGAVLFVLSLLAPAVIHGYLYRVYRELL
jgi:hypothetical protein